MNKVQQAAYELIREDARFFYTITDILRNANNINSNYICMSIPYMGVFADGSEQWCKKAKIEAPTFNEKEKAFYSQIRQGHKLFDKGYEEYKALLMNKFSESDNYFYSIRSLREKIFGYYNIGTDLCNGEFCGNTILCSMYIPIQILGNSNAGPWIRDMSYVAGKLASYFGCLDYPVYQYGDNLIVKYKDYHFFKSSPLKRNDEFGFLLFSILCSVNYVIEFIENYFVEEIPQKFKYAYLQYFYLCDFVNKLNQSNNTKYYLTPHLYNREFRNCIAHYGLGQYIAENEIVDSDVLKGLTNKAFKKDYLTTKAELYDALHSLIEQIKRDIL